MAQRRATLKTLPPFGGASLGLRTVANEDKPNPPPPKVPSTTQPRVPGSPQPPPQPRVIATGSQPRITPNPGQPRFNDTVAAPGMSTRQSGMQAALAQKPATNPPVEAEAAYFL